MPELKNISVVIVSYNSGDDLPSCLKSISESDIWDHITEVIVIDNASNDDSIDVVTEYANSDQKFKLIGLRENLGFPYACNLGVKSACADLVLIMNPDARLQHGFRKMLEFASSSKNIAAIQPKIIYDNGEVEATGGFMDFLGHGFHVTQSHDLEVQEIFYAVFACVLLDKSIYLKLGGMNSSYFLYNDDLDFCWRAWLAGYKVLHYSQANAVHSGQKSTRKMALIAQYHMRKNRLAMTFVNYSPFLGVLASFSNCIFYVGGSILGSLKKDFSDFCSFAYAIVWFAKNLQMLSQRRQVIQKNRRVSDHVFFDKKFIVLNLVGFTLHMQGYRKLDYLATKEK